MSNAEQAWKEFNTECNPIWDDVDGESDETQVMAGFLAGYTRGRADAWQLPELTLEDLKKPEMDGQPVQIHFEGSWRVGELIYDIEEQCCWIATTAHNKCISFDECQHVRGPLPLKNGGE